MIRGPPRWADRWTNAIAPKPAKTQRSV